MYKNCRLENMNIVAAKLDVWKGEGKNKMSEIQILEKYALDSPIQTLYVSTFEAKTYYSVCFQCVYCSCLMHVQNEL